MQNSKLLLHIPHSSSYVPEDPKGAYVISNDLIKKEADFLRDWDVIELFNPKGDIGSVVFPYSRIFCDPERFRDDKEESMSKKGMGALYTKCSDGMPLRVLGSDDHERLLAAYYDAHQNLVAEEVEKRLSIFNECLIVDSHTFPGYRMPFERESDIPRPDICIGTDDFHTPAKLLDQTICFFRGEGYSVEVNYPFAGAFVPAKYYLKDKRVCSIMVEVNRGYYGEDKHLFERMQSCVQKFLKLCAL